MGLPLDIYDGAAPQRDSPPPGGATGGPWLGVRFTCGGAYVRVLRDRGGGGYTARCPRCGKVVRFAVGPEGTSERFFEVSCS